MNNFQVGKLFNRDYVMISFLFSFQINREHKLRVQAQQHEDEIGQLRKQVALLKCELLEVCATEKKVRDSPIQNDVTQSDSTSSKASRDVHHNQERPLLTTVDGKKFKDKIMSGDEQNILSAEKQTGEINENDDDEVTSSSKSPPLSSTTTTPRSGALKRKASAPQMNKKCADMTLSNLDSSPTVAKSPCKVNGH